MTEAMAIEARLEIERFFNIILRPERVAALIAIQVSRIPPVREYQGGPRFPYPFG